MKFNELKQGEVYSCVYSGNNYTCRYDGTHSPHVTNKISFSQHGMFSIVGGDAFKPATEEEKIHILACIKKGAFISEEEALIGHSSYNIY